MPPIATSQMANKDSVIVDLGSAGSFANEQSLATKRVIGLAFSNSTGVAQKVIINPAYFGSDATKVIRTGVIATGLTCQCTKSGKSVEEMLAWFSRRPTHVLQMQVESDNTGQLNQVIVTQVKSLWGDEQEIDLNIASFKKAGNLNDKFLVVTQDDWFLDDETETSIMIPGVAEGTVNTTITFYCGASMSLPLMLYKSLRQAKV